MNTPLEALTKLREDVLLAVEQVGLNDTDRDLLREKLCALDPAAYAPVVEPKKVPERYKDFCDFVVTELDLASLIKGGISMYDAAEMAWNAAMRTALSSAPQDGWISVGDRLPSNTHNVSALGYVVNGGLSINGCDPMVGKVTYIPRKKIWLQSMGDYDEEVSVSHWMLLPSAPQDGWLPIETAPKDGTEVLIKTKVGLVSAWFSKGGWTPDTPNGPSEYEGDDWVCYDDKFQVDSEYVLGWMPLPSAPREGDK